MVETPRFFPASTDLADCACGKLMNHPRRGSGINKVHFVGSEFCGEGFDSPQGSPPRGERPADGGMRPASNRDVVERRKMLFEVEVEGDAVPRHEEVGVLGVVVG